MEVHIYIVKVKSQVGDNTKRTKPKENQLSISEISAREFRHFAGNSAEGLRSRSE